MTVLLGVHWLMYISSRLWGFALRDWRFLARMLFVSMSIWQTSITTLRLRSVVATSFHLKLVELAVASSIESVVLLFSRTLPLFYYFLLAVVFMFFFLLVGHAWVSELYYEEWFIYSVLFFSTCWQFRGIFGSRLDLDWQKVTSLYLLLACGRVSPSSTLIVSHTPTSGQDRLNTRIFCVL